MLVVKGSNFVHSETFLLVFQIKFYFFLSICKLRIVLMLPVSALNTIVNAVEKCSFSELDIEKVKFFTQIRIPNFFSLTFLMLEVT